MSLWDRQASVVGMCVCMSTLSNIFSSEMTGQIKAKFHMKPPCGGGTKVYSNGPDHMTKMAAIPIYGKNLKQLFFFGTKQPMILKLGMQRSVLEYYQFYSNHDPGLTLTYFTARSNCPLCFCMGKR